jgi:hypothetical protein
LWKSFHAQFNGILENLTRHRNLVDTEALSIEITEAKISRAQMQHSIDLKAKERQNTQLRDVINWLAVEDHVQDDTLDRFLRRREPGTCDWILANHRLASWLEDNGDEPILWLRGIPGAGKLSLSFLAEPGLISFYSKSHQVKPPYVLASYLFSKIGEKYPQRIISAAVLSTARARTA